MEDKALGYMGLCVGGIGCYSRRVPCSAGMATPDVLLAQSFMSKMCFGRAFHMKGAVLTDKGVFGACWVFQVVIQRGDWVRGGGRCMSNGAGGS